MPNTTPLPMEETPGYIPLDENGKFSNDAIALLRNSVMLGHLIQKLDQKIAERFVENSLKGIEKGDQ